MKTNPRYEKRREEFDAEVFKLAHGAGRNYKEYLRQERITHQAKKATLVNGHWSNIQNVWWWYCDECYEYHDAPHAKDGK